MNAADNFEVEQPNMHPCSCARARANDFGGIGTPLAGEKKRHKGDRVVCGARRRRDGGPCQARPEPNKSRCRFHGGCSTGPRTVEGKVRSLSNLKQFSRNKVG